MIQETRNTKDSPLCYTSTDLSFHYYHINCIRQLTNTIYETHLSPVNFPLKHQAGQYCKLLCLDEKLRPYSIVNCPDEKGTIVLHIRITNNNKSMQTLIRTGNLVKIKGPYGNCTYASNYKDATIFLAEGVGIAAFHAIFESKQLGDSPKLLIWIKNSLDSKYLKKNIVRWLSEMNNISVLNLDSSGEYNSAILNSCTQFLSTHKKIRLYLAGSKNIHDFIYDNFTIPIKEGIIDFFSDI